MKARALILGLGLLATNLALSGCVTAVPVSSLPAHSAKPSYEDYFDQYMFGFIGRADIALDRICMDQSPRLVTESRTGEDLILTFITMGIYTPVTIKVWCEN